MYDCLIVRPEQTLSGEQSHLSVVSDRSLAPIGFSKVPYPFFAKGLPDLGETHELNRGTQGISNCTTEQTTPEPQPLIIHRLTHPPLPALP
jgi:hypothetical protein